MQRRSFDTRTSDSWAFFNIGSSRNKRKLPSGRETSADFSCRDRPPGYYADMNLGCEVSTIYNSNPVRGRLEGGQKEGTSRRSWCKDIPLKLGHLIVGLSLIMAVYKKRKLPSSRETSADFSRRDRPPGYYADMNLGCEVSTIHNSNPHVMDQPYIT